MLITNRCPFSCAHCSQKATPYKRGFLDIQAYLKLFEDVFGQVIMFSGGEPFAHPDFYDTTFSVLRSAIGHFRDIIICTTLERFTEPWEPSIPNNSAKRIAEVLNKNSIAIKESDLADGNFYEQSEAIREQLYRENPKFKRSVNRLLSFLGPLVGKVRFSLSANPFLAASDKYLWQRIQVQLYVDSLLRKRHGIFIGNKILYYIVASKKQEERKILFKYGIRPQQMIWSSVYKYGKAVRIPWALPAPRTREPEFVVREDGLLYNNKYDARSDPKGKLKMGSVDEPVRAITSRSQCRILLS